jgi:hypothetical protein
MRGFRAFGHWWFRAWYKTLVQSGLFYILRNIADIGLQLRVALTLIMAACSLGGRRLGGLMDFQLVAHCDWSIEARKRWMVVAQLRDGVWCIATPELVGDGASLIPNLRGRLSSKGSMIVGFDFSIGLPEAYATRAGFTSFRQALSVLGQGEWSQWFSVAQHRDEISIQRPFYPMRPGGTRKSHQIEALGMVDANSLLRNCELATLDRQAACSLFWTSSRT